MRPRLEQSSFSEHISDWEIGMPDVQSYRPYSQAIARTSHSVCVRRAADLYADCGVQRMLRGLHSSELEAGFSSSEPTSVQDAGRWFPDRKSDGSLAKATLDKLTTIFGKQFLAWAPSAGFDHLAEIATADLEAFRDA